MKRIKLMILSLIIILMPTIIKADMSAPSLTPYEIIVTNPSGINAYCNTDQEDVILPVDTVLEVKVEVDDGIYGYVSDTGKYYTIELSKFQNDIALISDEIDLSKWEKHSTKKYVFKSGAYLYNGPSKIYGKVKGNIEIPVGTIITSDYQDEQWLYVTYNGVSGWVYYYSYGDETSLADVLEEEKIVYTITDAKISPYKDFDVTLEKTIPRYTEVTVKYVFSSRPWEKDYYISYEGFEGWVSGEDALEKAEQRIITIDEVDIYEIINGEQNIIGKIPKNTELISQYVTESKVEDTYFVEYNGIKGIAIADNIEYYLNSKILKESNEKVDIYSDAPIYTEINGSQTDKKINAGEITIKYKYYDNEKKIQWSYVNDGQNEGWIILITTHEYNEEDNIVIPGVTTYTITSEMNIYDEIYGTPKKETIKPGKVTVMDSKEVNNIIWLNIKTNSVEGWIKLGSQYHPDTIINNNIKPNKTEKDPILFEYEEEKKTSILTVLIYGLIIAVIVDLTFVVSMKLINKRKNIKIENSPAEQPKEQEVKENKEQK